MCVRGAKSFFARLAGFMANSSPPWSAYRALMACRLVALDKNPGLRPVGIGETLRQSLNKLVMREVGEQAKTACGNLQLCAGLKAGIEGAAHALGKKRLERTRVRHQEGEEAGESDEEESGGGVVSVLTNIGIETTGTEEGEERLYMVLVIEVKETSEGEEVVMGIERHWEPKSPSLRMQRRAEQRLMITVMGSTS